MDATKTVEQTRETAEDLKSRAQDWVDTAKGKVRDAGAAADLYQREYTWTTVALVAVAAVCVGFLAGRRSS